LRAQHEKCGGQAYEHEEGPPAAHFVGDFRRICKPNPNFRVQVKAQ